MNSSRVFEVKEVLNGCAELLGKFQSQLEAGLVAESLDGNDCLPTHANTGAQLFLGVPRGRPADLEVVFQCHRSNGLVQVELVRGLEDGNSQKEGQGDEEDGAIGLRR